MAILIWHRLISLLWVYLVRHIVPLFCAPRSRGCINPPLLQRPAEGIPDHGISPNRVLHEPFLQLRPHILDRLGIAREGRHLELHEAGGVGVDEAGRVLEALEILPQSLLTCGRSILRAAGLEHGAELAEGDVDGDGGAAGEGDGLEGQVGGVGGEAGEQGVHEGVDEEGEARARDGVGLEGAEGEQRDPAPVAAELEVAEEAEAVEAGGGDAVVRDDLRLQAAPDVVAQRRAVPPARDVGAEALVGEALRRVREHVRGRLEVDEEVARREVAAQAGRGRRRRVRDLVGVVEGGEAPEAALDVALAGVEGHAQGPVEAAGAPQLPVGLVDGVE